MPFKVDGHREGPGFKSRAPDHSSRLGAQVLPGRPGGDVHRASLVLVAELCHEFGQQVPELFHLPRAEEPGPLMLQSRHFFRGRSVISPALFSATDDPSARIARVVDALDITGGLELINKISHRLLGHRRRTSQMVMRSPSGLKTRSTVRLDSVISLKPRSRSREWTRAVRLRLGIERRAPIMKSRRLEATC